MLQLHREGYSLRAIAHLTGTCRHTVRKYVMADAFPEISQRAGRPGQLAPYEGYLRQRWHEGCHNATQLWREIGTRGFGGEVKAVRTFVGRWRAALPQEARRTTGPRPRQSARQRVPAPRSVVWWLLGEPEKQSDAERAFAERLLEASPPVAAAQALLSEFFEMVRQRQPAKLEDWLHRAAESGVGELQRFGAGLRRDGEAVVAALTLPWSNGPTEGSIHRLKLIKRQMHGRAAFDLLRARVLPARSLSPARSVSIRGPPADHQKCGRADFASALTRAGGWSSGPSR